MGTETYHLWLPLPSTQRACHHGQQRWNSYLWHDASVHSHPEIMGPVFSCIGSHMVINLLIFFPHHRSAERQYHTAYPLPASDHPAATHLHQYRWGLRWEGSAFHHHRGFEVSSGKCCFTHVCFLYIAIVIASGPTCSLCDWLFIFASSTGSLRCRWAHHPERTCVSAGQWGPHRKSLHLWPHPGRRFAGMKPVAQPANLVCVYFLCMLNFRALIALSSFRHIWPSAKSSQRPLKWSRWLSRRLRELGLS